MTRTAAICTGMVLTLCAAAAPARAQAVRRWEIEGFGGGVAGGSSTDGTSAALPSAGTFATYAGKTTLRSSSYLFGDGAVLVNGVNAAFGIPSSQITPLDGVLATGGGTHAGAAAFGARLAYALTPRYAAEVSVASTASNLRMTDAMKDGIERSRNSFTTAFQTVFSTGGSLVFSGSAVTSTASMDDGSTRQLVTTGALRISLLRPGHRAMPYVVAGGGVASNYGDAPSATIVGHYTANTLSGVNQPLRFPMNETDTVTVRLESRRSAVGVFGGGVSYSSSHRWGVRADVRAQISGNTTDVVLGATPAVAESLPALAIASNTLPNSIQFGNSSTYPSSLTGPPITGFTTFKGSGTAVQVMFTGGVFRRF